MEKIRGNHRIIGILASVDSGKTTLAEALLFASGALRRKGRVDHGDAFLDTGEMERRRGITIFSKTARFEAGAHRFILVDTPGHADFTPETERTLTILDYCILVINGADGVTGQTKRLWQLLDAYDVPVLVFVNKTDQPGVDTDAVYAQIRRELSGHIVDFALPDPLLSEEIASLSEDLLEEFFKQGALTEPTIRQSIDRREVFPCLFGSALKETGVEELLKALSRWTNDEIYPGAFSARVYKISRDEDGQRLTHMKVTGGSLKNKTAVGEEKINEIRLYSGTGYELAQSAEAGELCAATGLKATRAGQVLGEGEEVCPVIRPVLSYRVLLEEGGDSARLLALLRKIGEEMPDLSVRAEEDTGSVYVQVTGELLLEVLADLVKKRGGMTIRLDEGEVLYRESVTEETVGIGHYEPLRHYAEVQLLLEPSADYQVSAASVCPLSELAPGRQNLILDFLRSCEHTGVLIGAPLAHLHITLLAAREHDKHTQGGDLLQAAARALRQGLMEARRKGACTLLEPVYEFDIAAPLDKMGRILTDLNRLGAAGLSTRQEKERVRLSGRGAVSSMKGYAAELFALSRGEARIGFDFAGYEVCQNAPGIINKIGYDPDRDPANPSGSVFCISGAGQYVPWDMVSQKAHIPPAKAAGAGNDPALAQRPPAPGTSISPDEIEQILTQTFYANASTKKQWKRKKTEKAAAPRGKAAATFQGPACLLVDGYNVIHAWPDLKDLASVSFDGAREKLMEILKDYQGYTGEDVTVVFDAYRVSGGSGSHSRSGRLEVVFTRENETADRYIERRAMELSGTCQVKVVTSDQAEQMLALGTGALVYSSRRFLEILGEVRRQGLADLERRTEREEPNRPFSDRLSDRSEEERGRS